MMPDPDHTAIEEIAWDTTDNVEWPYGECADRPSEHSNLAREMLLKRAARRLSHDGIPPSEGQYRFASLRINDNEHRYFLACRRKPGTSTALPPEQRFQSVSF